MAVDFQLLGIDRLTVSERWELVDFILASLPEPERAEPIELSEEQIIEIKRRRAASDADPERGRPWREVIAEIRAEL